MIKFQKLFFIQSINPRAVLTIIVWIIVAWVLSKPLQYIGQSTYKFLGSITNNAFENIKETKSNAEELLTAKTLVTKQAKEISLLKIKAGYLENQIKGYENLKQLLNLKKNTNHKTIAVNVIGRSPDNWHKQIIIDKGKSEGIMIGDAVFSTKGIAGQIVDVEKNTSIAQLISDPSYKIGCKIVRKNILGILTGKTSSTGLIQFIPVSRNVKVGDSVITSGIGVGGKLPTYPSNYPIGKVSKVSKRSNKASDLYIEVKFAENLNSLSDVLVFSPN